MRVSTNWLREYIDTGANGFSLKTLADRLTMAGLEVEETHVLTRGDFAAAGGSGEAEDVVWDVKVTPNRGDWLSMIGVARELGPIVDSRKRLPEPRLVECDPPASDFINIRIDAPDLCGRYVGVVIRGVEIKQSPGWLKDRIIASGMRPINNVVDVTNYVMMELGQPLHAFDYKLLHGPEIIVRRARAGETIKSIDEVERKLDPEMLVIADADRPVAIAGIMGGFDSEISEQTKDILIESANFNSVSIRRTAKRLAMSSESSYRFERGVDPLIALLAARRAAELIRELGGGEIAKGEVDVFPVPVEPVVIRVRPDRANMILGTSMDAGTMAVYLESIEIPAEVKGDALECRAPSFRSDITREIDLIEEIGRVYGYDKFETTLPATPGQGADSPEGRFRERLRRVLMSCGAQEALTHSVVDAKLAELAGRADERLGIRNPLSEELSSMRVMLAPNLLQVIERNQSFGNPDVNVFEIGKVYYRKRDGEIGEKLAVAGALVGNLWSSAWALSAKALDVDFFVCKGIVESLLGTLAVSGGKFAEVTDPLLHPTRAAKVMVCDREIGILGEVAPSVQEALGLRGRTYVYEIDFHALMESVPDTITYQEPPRYPAVSRHVAVVAADTVAYETLVDLVREAGEGLVESIELLDVYRGEHIESDKRSLTLGIVFRSREKTLTEDEVNAVLSAMKDALSREVNATFR